VAGSAIGWDGRTDHFEAMTVVREQHDLPIGEVLLEHGKQRAAIGEVKTDEHIVEHQYFERR